MVFNVNGFSQFIPFFSVLRCETLHIIYHLFNFSVNCWSMLLEIIVNYSPQQSNCELTKKCEKDLINSVFLLLCLLLFDAKALCLFQCIAELFKTSCFSDEWSIIVFTSKSDVDAQEKKIKAHHCVQKLYIWMLS